MSQRRPKIEAVCRAVSERIRKQADPERAEREQRYFKGTIRSRGLSVPKSQAIARDIFREYRSALTDDDWLELAERPADRRLVRGSTVGLEVVRKLRLPASKALFQKYESWLDQYVGNWAHCDDLCSHLIGSLLMDEPGLAECLPRWAASPNRWLRRGAAVSLVIPARNGLFLDEALRIAELLVEDGDDLVQKGCGWMLREAAKPHQREVTAFLERHARRMRRTAFRYAIEKFSPDERRRLMAL